MEKLLEKFKSTSGISIAAIIISLLSIGLSANYICYDNGLKKVDDVERVQSDFKDYRIIPYYIFVKDKILDRYNKPNKN